MVNMIDAIKNTIPISLFNRGLAGKIFEEVKITGAKVVMKNNSAECVLISPDEYVKLMEEINEARLLNLANERMQSYDPDTVISGDTVLRNLGLTNLPDDEVEFE